MGNIGPGELLIIALIALLIFGAGRIADIGKGLGQGIKNFKAGLKEGDEAAGEEEEEKKVAKKAPKEAKSEASKKKRVVVEEEDEEESDEAEGDEAKPKKA